VTSSPTGTGVASVLPRRPILDRRHGRLPEWPKGADCKSAGIAYVGSNPTPATTTPNVQLVRTFGVSHFTERIL
jgi:hypothetical protein